MERLAHPDVAVQRLCQLQADVVRGVLGFQQPNDCFCNSDGNHPEQGYRSTGQAIDYIERVVRIAITIHRPLARINMAVRKARAGFLEGLHSL